MSSTYRIEPLSEKRHAKGSCIEFLELSEASIVIPQSPAFIFGTLPRGLAKSYFCRTHLPAIGVYTAKDCELSRGFLLGHKGSTLSCAEANIHTATVEGELRKWGGPPTLCAKDVPGTTALLHGPGYQVFGHWLVDLLPKLFLLQSAGLDIYRINFALPTDAPAFAKNLLALVGICDSQIISYDPAQESLHLETAAIPPILHNGVRMSPLFGPAVQFLNELVALTSGEIAPTSSEKGIYLSRGKLNKNRELINRQEIEKTVSDKGYLIVEPQKLPLAEQISLFAGAKRIVGEYGSALHMSIFSPPGTVVCGLRGVEGHPAFIQSGVGAATGQPTGYVFGEMASDDGAFTVSNADFADCIDALGRSSPQGDAPCKLALNPVRSDESAYLARNDDVAEAVLDGRIPSGRAHFIRYGAAEGRAW